MQRVLALDVGDRRIGLAVSDALGITAQGIETYTRTGDLEKDAAYIRSVAENTAPFACCSECRATWMAAMAFSLKRCARLQMRFLQSGMASMCFMMNA